MDVSLGDNPAFLRAGSPGLPALLPCRLPLPTGWQSGLSGVQLSSLYVLTWLFIDLQFLVHNKHFNHFVMLLLGIFRYFFMLNALEKFCVFFFNNSQAFSIFICA